MAELTKSSLLCWVKMRGYPWWPARVEDPLNKLWPTAAKSNKFKVFFFNYNDQTARVKREDMKEFEPNLKEFSGKASVDQALDEAKKWEKKHGSESLSITAEPERKKRGRKPKAKEPEEDADREVEAKVTGKRGRKRKEEQTEPKRKIAREKEKLSEPEEDIEEDPMEVEDGIDEDFVPEDKPKKERAVRRKGGRQKAEKPKPKPEPKRRNKKEVSVVDLTALAVLLQRAAMPESKPEDINNAAKVLTHLCVVPMTVDLLKESKIGRAVAALRRHKDQGVQVTSKKLVVKWKSLIAASMAPTSAIVTTSVTEPDNRMESNKETTKPEQNETTQQPQEEEPKTADTKIEPKTIPNLNLLDTGAVKIIDEISVANATVGSEFSNSVRMGDVASVADQASINGESKSPAGNPEIELKRENIRSRFRDVLDCEEGGIADQIEIALFNVCDGDMQKYMADYRQLYIHLNLDKSSGKKTLKETLFNGALTPHKFVTCSPQELATYRS